MKARQRTSAPRRSGAGHCIESIPAARTLGSTAVRCDNRQGQKRRSSYHCPNSGLLRQASRPENHMCTLPPHHRTAPFSPGSHTRTQLYTDHECPQVEPKTSHGARAGARTVSLRTVVVKCRRRHSSAGTPMTSAVEGPQRQGQVHRVRQPTKNAGDGGDVNAPFLKRARCSRRALTSRNLPRHCILCPIDVTWPIFLRLLGSIIVAPVSFMLKERKSAKDLINMALSSCREPPISLQRGATFT